MNLPFPNKELAVQFPAIAWLKRNWGYEEVKSGEDDDALGSPIDSLGLMNGRTLLVEIKVAISAGMARYNPSGSGSIEGKIARTLKGLHEQRQDMIWPAIRSTWDPSQPPVFVILARGYSEAGFEEMTEVLRRRSIGWLFDFLVWEWTGYDVRQRGRGRSEPLP
jgi:hypothetical protein